MSASRNRSTHARDVGRDVALWFGETQADYRLLKKGENTQNLLDIALLVFTNANFSSHYLFIVALFVFTNANSFKPDISCNYLCSEG